MDEAARTTYVRIDCIEALVYDACIDAIGNGLTDHNELLSVGYEVYWHKRPDELEIPSRYIDIYISSCVTAVRLAYPSSLAFEKDEWYREACRLLEAVELLWAIRPYPWDLAWTQRLSIYILYLFDWLRFDKRYSDTGWRNELIARSPNRDYAEHPTMALLRDQRCDIECMLYTVKDYLSSVVDHYDVSTEHLIEIVARLFWCHAVCSPITNSYEVCSSYDELEPTLGLLSYNARAFAYLSESLVMGSNPYMPEECGPKSLTYLDTCCVLTNAIGALSQPHSLREISEACQLLKLVGKSSRILSSSSS